jgi:hypothetical protein
MKYGPCIYQVAPATQSVARKEQYVNRFATFFIAPLLHGSPFRHLYLTTKTRAWGRTKTRTRSDTRMCQAEDAKGLGLLWMKLTENAVREGYMEFKLRAQRESS